MPISLSRNLPRFNGTSITLDFAERPICRHCKKTMRIVSSPKSKLVVGLRENYEVRKVYYQCGQALCPGGDESYKTPENTFYPSKSHYDYDIYAKVVELRWKYKITYEEIVKEMEARFGILINHSMIEKILKIYEIGCSIKYKPEYVEKINANGGVLLTIDGMKPLKGNKPLYVDYLYFTGLTIHAQRLTSETQKNISTFLRNAKKRINEELGVKVIGIVSDALPAQRKAIEEVFPDVPHCLCHYHFFKLVFKEPKALDNSLMTQTRKFLRSLFYLKKKEVYSNKGWAWETKSSFTDDLLELLRNLSNWKVRPKDPYFVGLTLYARLKDVYRVLDLCVKDLEAKNRQFKDEKVVRKLHSKLKEFFKTKTDDVKELKVIRKYLSDIKNILDEPKTSAEIALKKMEKYCDTLKKQSSRANCGLTEKVFVVDLLKFVESKGEKLFAFKRIKGAPRTNNSHELMYKQLKHFLRRVIGHNSAKSYLLSHGERIVFVKEAEMFEGILEIIKNTDHEFARDLIESERVSRSSIKFIIHNPVKWELKIEDLIKKWKNLEY